MREGTLKELNVKVGDKVRPINNGRGFAVENGRLLVLTDVDHNYAHYKGKKVSHPEELPWPFSNQLIFRLEEEAVEEIKVGDEVCYKDGLDTILCEVLAEGAYWVVINYQGGRPWVVNKEEVRKPKPKPVVEEVVMCVGKIERLHARHPSTFYWVADEYDSPAATDTHKITFNLIDGEPDCNSIKMEKL